MRKLIFTLLFSLVTLGFVSAQTIFDPATVSETDTAGWGAKGFKIVDINGIKYVKAVVDGWNSTVNIPVYTIASNRGFSCKVLYKAAASNSQFAKKTNVSVQLISTAVGDSMPNWNASAKVPASGAATANDSLLTSLKKIKGTFYKTQTAVGQIQVSGQETASWGPVSGDTIYFGAISTYDASAVIDPDNFDVTGTDITLVKIDGVSYLKVPTDLGWSTQLKIEDGFANGDMNQYRVPCKVELTSSSKTAIDGGIVYHPALLDSVQVNIGAFTSSALEVGTSGQVATSTIVNDTVTVTPNTTTSYLRAVLQYRTGNWKEITGAYLYIGKVTAAQVTDKMADARLTYNVTKINYEIDPAAEENDEIWADASVAVANIDQLALGTPAGTKPTASDNSGSFQMVWNDKYLYVLIKVKDDQVVSLKNSSDDQPWNIDGVEMFFDHKNQRPIGKRYKTQQQQIRINCGAKQVTGEGGILNPTTYNAGRWGSEATTVEDGDSLVWYQTPISGGYQILARYPWFGFYRTTTADKADSLKNLAAADIVADKLFAFEMSLLDGDVYNVRKSILNWNNNSGSDQAYTNSGVWGAFKLLAGTQTAVKLDAASGFKMFPNPATSDVKVSMNNLRSIEVFDMTGKLVAKQVASSNVANINVASVKAGVYFVKVYTDKGFAGVSKLVKN